MYLSKLLHGFVKEVTYIATCVCQVVTSISRPLSNETKLKLLLTKLQHLTKFNYWMPGSIMHLFIFFCLWPHEEGVGDDHLPVRSKARALVHLQKMKLIRQQVNKIKDVRGWQSEQCDWTRRTSLTRRSPCRCPPRPCHRCPPPPSAQLQPRSCQQKQWRKDCDKHYLLMARCQI